MQYFASRELGPAHQYGSGLKDKMRGRAQNCTWGTEGSAVRASKLDFRGPTAALPSSEQLAINSTAASMEMSFTLDLCTSKRFTCAT